MKSIPTCQPADSLVPVRDVSQAAEPLVSVILVCYNQAPFAEECLDSISSQTYRNLEVIIIDDCSDDDSAAVIQSWLARTGANATLILHDVNAGVCRTFNEALARANGQYISLIAADDVYLPHKIESQVALFEKLASKVGVVYSDAWQIDESGQLLSERFIEAHRKFESMPEGRVFGPLLEGNFIPAMSTLIRRGCFQAIGPYDEQLVYEDYDMWLRLSSEYDFVFSPVVSARYRVVQNSVTRAVLQSSARGLPSDFRILEKCLRAKNLTSLERQTIKRRLKGVGFDIYARNCGRRTLYLLKLFWYAPGKYSLSMLLFASAGVPFRYFEALLSRWAGSQEPGAN